MILNNSMLLRTSTMLMACTILTFAGARDVIAADHSTELANARATILTLQRENVKLKSALGRLRKESPGGTSVQSGSMSVTSSRRSNGETLKGHAQQFTDLDEEDGDSHICQKAFAGEP